MSSFLPRLLTFAILWSSIAAIVITKSFLGVFLFVFVLGLIAQWECYCLQQKTGSLPYKKIGLCAGAAFLGYHGYFFLIQEQGKYSSLFLAFAESWGMGIIAPALFILLSADLILRARSGLLTIEPVAATFFGFLYVPYLFHFFLKILEIEGGFVPAVYCIAVTKMTDAGAYLVGSIFGKHKMCPAISPGKTWEGFAGGLFFAVLTSMSCIFINSLLVNLRLEHYAEKLTFEYLYNPFAYILPLVLAGISVLGDLFKSQLKRAAHVKDSGKIIPGMGGALDLIDSLLFTAPVFYGLLLLDKYFYKWS